MKILETVCLVALALLSLIAGLAKMIQAEPEVAFFESAGVELWTMLPFGILQVAGALTAMWPSMRRIGLTLIILGFALSTTMIVAAGNMTFAAASLLPLALAAWLYFKEKRAAS